MSRVTFVAALAAFASLVLGGCQSSIDSSSQDWPTTSPSKLAAPIWQVGDKWNYISSNGVWENWTVEAHEVRRERQTYRISVSMFPPDDFGHDHNTVWYDVESLGLVEQVYDDGIGGYGSPKNQIFPLVNRTYGATNHYSWGPTETMTIDSTVKGWVRTITPAGEFWAVELHTVDRELGNDMEHAWYNPEVGNFVRYNPYEEFSLVSWHRA